MTEYETVVENADQGTLAAIFAVIASFAIVFLIIGVIWYILAAVGFYKMAKDRDMDNAWIAWIPICQNYIMGELTGNTVWNFGYASWILVIGQIISSLLGYFGRNVTGIGATLIFIYAIVFYVYYMTALYKLYKTYSTKATIMLVTSIIFPFLASIYIFAIRNNPRRAVA